MTLTIIYLPIILFNFSILKLMYYYIDKYIFETFEIFGFPRWVLYVWMLIPIVNLSLSLLLAIYFFYLAGYIGIFSKGKLTEKEKTKQLLEEKKYNDILGKIPVKNIERYLRYMKLKKIEK